MYSSAGLGLSIKSTNNCRDELSIVLSAIWREGQKCSVYTIQQLRAESE